MLDEETLQCHAKKNLILSNFEKLYCFGRLWTNPFGNCYPELKAKA